MNFKKIILIILFTFYFSSLPANNKFFQEGLILYKSKKFDEAKFKFEQDIVFNPKNENSYLYLAKIHKFKKDDSEEEKNLNTVILLNPKNEEAVLNLALLKIRKSNYEETKKLIKDLSP